VPHKTKGWEMAVKTMLQTINTRCNDIQQEKQCAYNVTLMRVRVTIVLMEKQYYMCSESVILTLDIQHAIQMRYIAICCLPGTTVFFPDYLTNGTMCDKKFLNTKCVFSFSLQPLSETFPVLRRTERDVIKMCCGLHVKCLLFSSYFHET
jgi:hypothetical protein